MARGIDVKDLKEVCVAVARRLATLHHEEERIEREDQDVPRLIFPLYERRSKRTPRISEQEARVLFLQEVQKDKYDGIYYSIETPTDYRYSFGKEVSDLECLRRGRRGQSASYDMSLYKLTPRGKLEQAVNIEFKAHNVELTHIAKDFLKLMVEKYPGVFFHVLERVDKKTLTVCSEEEEGVLAKYERAFKELAENKACIRHDDFDHDRHILFAICCLNPKFIMTKRIRKAALMQGCAFLDFLYRIRRIGDYRYEMVVTDQNGWQIETGDGWDVSFASSVSDKA